MSRQVGTGQPSRDGDGTDVVVVGGGLAGLTAAATAARAGASVTLLEARGHAGGRARTFDVDGFLLNQGPHALYRGGAAWATLATLGIRPRGSSPSTSSGLGLRSDGRLAALPASGWTLLRTSLVSAADKVELARVLRDVEAFARTASVDRSAAAWLRTRLRRPGARAVVAMLARVATYTGDLDGIDAASAAQQMLQAMTAGVVYLDDGWQQLVDSLRVVAHDAGVRLATTAKVDSVTGVHDCFVTRGTGVEVRSPTVVIAAGGPADAARLLGATSPVVARWAARERPVVVGTLDVGLRALPDPRRRFVVGLDEPLYLSVHTPAARLAPAGGEVVHVAWYGEPDRATAARLEAFLETVQPAWRDHAVAVRPGDRLVVAHGRPEPGRGKAGRPAVAVPDLPGAFVAGDWVGDTGLLADAVFASAREAGEAAAARAASSPARAPARAGVRAGRA